MSELTDPEILMTAILSMDVYNRDPDAKDSSPEVRASLGQQLGDGVLKDTQYDTNTLFGAAAWNYNGQIIVAYRGTVFSRFFTEAFNGYGVGAASAFGTQATQALQFYQRFTAGPSIYAKAGIILTGHSLGGGLAGFVGAIYGQQGELSPKSV